jgi:hypothetical protein
MGRNKGGYIMKESTSSRRMALTDEQLKAAPTVEEAIEAIFGDVA